MATNCSILALRIARTEERGGLTVHRVAESDPTQRLSTPPRSAGPNPTSPPPFPPHYVCNFLTALVIQESFRQFAVGFP